MSRVCVKIEVYNSLNGQFYSGRGEGERFVHLHADMGVSLGVLFCSENMQKTYEYPKTVDLNFPTSTEKQISLAPVNFHNLLLSLYFI